MSLRLFCYIVFFVKNCKKANMYEKVDFSILICYTE